MATSDPISFPSTPEKAFAILPQESREPLVDVICICLDRARSMIALMTEYMEQHSGHRSWPDESLHIINGLYSVDALLMQANEALLPPLAADAPGANPGMNAHPFDEK